jgi:N-glycosidase YbiA
LSNFEPSGVELEGETYPAAEHAFQAAKTHDQDERRAIRAATTPAQAKQLGRGVKLRPDWEAVKVVVMYELVRQKFANNAELREQLLATGDAELVEVNNWRDRFWGVYRGEGRNELGKILMRVREELASSV